MSGSKHRQQNLAWYERTRQERADAARRAAAQRRPVDGMASVRLQGVAIELDVHQVLSGSRPARTIPQAGPGRTVPPKREFAPGSPADYQRHVAELKDNIEPLRDPQEAKRIYMRNYMARRRGRVTEEAG